MNPKRTHKLHSTLGTLIFFACASLSGIDRPASAAQAATKVFVKDGAAEAVQFVGEPWKRGPGYLEGVGMDTRLVCKFALGEGDFHISAELSLPRLLRLAPALGVGEFSHLQLDANGGRIIVGGPLFVPDEQMIRYTILGKNDELIEPNEPFVLEVIRKGDEVSFLFDGQLFHSQEVTRKRAGPISVFPGEGLSSLCAVRVHNLSVTGRLHRYGIPHMTAYGAVLDSRVRWAPHLKRGPFAKLRDGGVMMVSDGNFLDIGGRGNHDGAFEPTIAELPDGRTWMLMRTNLDYLWSAYSDNQGLFWRVIEPSQFDASSSPAQLTRLSSGRVALVWNRLYPEGKHSYRRRVGKWSEQSASWCREELAITISDKAGKNWTEPVVIARKPGAWLAYVQVFEYRPGRLWVTTGMGGLRLELSERDFLRD